jgi:CHASE2 domain-containing sensor protein
VIALVALAIGLSLYLWDPEPVERLELSTIDARFSVRGSSVPDPRVVMIRLDDRTLARFRAQRARRIPRGQYAPMFERLRRDGAAAIAVDLHFTDRDENDLRGDSELLDGIRATRDRLVLAFDDFAIVRNSARNGSWMVRPELLGQPAAVQSTGVTTGYAGLPADKDGSIRRAEYRVVGVNSGTGADRNATMATFAFAAADVARRAGVVPEVERDATASRRAWGGQTDRTTWIDYRGPAGTIPSVSAIDVIDGRVPAGTFRNKVVVIGLDAKRAADVKDTPLDSAMPGMEAQANAIETMLRGEPLRDVPPPVDILVIVLLAFAPAAAALKWSGRATAAVIAALVLVLLVAAQLAFQAGWIVAVVVPLVALVAAALGLATRTLIRRLTTT